MVETRIFVCKNVKNYESKKSQIVEKLKIMVSADITVTEDVIVVNKATTWVSSKATINLTKKGNDVELIFTSSHHPTDTAYLVGCLALVLTLILVIVPWFFYDKDSKDFDSSVINALNYVTLTR